ncbi:MAG: YbbR-like domain-containing protein [Bilifractor sp.]|jgi:YbbR domain-containing protein
MGKSLAEKLKTNLGLKILSVLISIVIWYAVVRVNDPVITRSFTVNVTFTNETYIKSGKQTFTVDSAYNTVIVYVKGNRSEIRGIEASDITVTADLTQIVSMDTTPVMVPLTVSCGDLDPTSLTLSRTAIPITIEDIASKELPVTVDAGDSTPAQNYEVGTTSANPTNITISGPESTIDDIDSAVATIDVSGLTQDSTVEGTLHLYDKSQDEILSETVENEITFDTGSEKISVYVDLWERVSDISLDVQYSGEPKDGYQVSGVSTVPETLTVVGDDDALSTLQANGNKITIPADEISIEGYSSDVTKEIDLSEILTGNLRIASTSSETVTVTITILAEDTKELNIDVDKISINNLSSDLTVTYDQTELTIRVRGMKSKLDQVTADNVTASIDLSGYGEGDYTVPVTITLPDGTELAEDVTIALHVKKSANSS